MKKWQSVLLIGLTLPTLLVGQVNRTLTVREHGPTGRLFAKPKSAKDTLWLKAGGEFVRAVVVAPAKPWPGALTVKVDINTEAGYFNAQGQTAGLSLDGTSFRYSIDGGQTWQGVAWAWKLTPGTYTVRCEFTRPGYVVGVAEKTFTIPGKATGPPSGNLPGGAPPTEPKPTNPKPKPDENRTEAPAGNWEELDHAFPYSTTPNTVNWQGVPEFRFNPGELFAWNCPLTSPNQVDLGFARGITHFENSVLKNVGRRDVPGSKRYYMIHRAAYGADLDVANPDITRYPLEYFRDRTAGDLGGQKAEFNDRAAPAWVDDDWEVGNDAEGPLVGLWGQVRRYTQQGAFDAGATEISHYDIYPYPTGDDLPSHFMPQWSALEAAGNRATRTNSVPYFFLNTWEPCGDCPSGWHMVDVYGSRSDFIAERKRTEHDWAYRIVQAMENQRRQPVPTVAYMTWGWAQSGMPRNELGTVRPDMMEATAIFQMLLGGKTPSLNLWAADWDGKTRFSWNCLEALLNGAYRASLFNAERLGSPEPVSLEISFDGVNWLRESTQQARAAKHPIVRGLRNGSSLIVAALAPALVQGQQVVWVRWGNWTRQLILEPYKTRLGRVRL